MKAIITLFFATFFCFSGFISVHSEELKSTIQITIMGIPDTKGKLNIGLYDKESDFPDELNMFQGQTIRIDKKEITVWFSRIPQGDYAIAVFYDENNNGKLDKSFVGRPTEAYGFSNDAQGLLGAPTFEDARIRLQANETLKIKIHVE